MRPVRRLGDDRGSASVVAVAAIAVICVVAVSVAFVMRARAARHAAQSAADLSALAAAEAIQDGSDPCVAAEHVAALNHAGVLSCDVTGEAVVVRVQVEVDLGVFGVRVTQGTARAGPVDYFP